MQLFTGDMGETASFTRREFRAIAGLGWPDGRDVTLWLEMWAAKRRHGTKSRLSRYAVAEVKQVGFMGRVFVFDREFGEEYADPTVPEPPYTVRIDHHGEVKCGCMAGNCRAPSCRHADAALTLIDLGAFDHNLIQGA
jgi:hypothetical protein